MDSDKALERLQAEEFDILQAIAAFCEEHQIKWFIDAGTLLGAARHGGFIPWDDDVDIAMLRQDYNRFLALAEQGFIPGYSVHTFDNTPGFSGMFAKVYKDGTSFITQETQDAGCQQGIFVDIFPYDVLSKDSATALKQRRNAKIWQSVSYMYYSRHIVVPHKGFLGAIEKFGCYLLHFPIRLFCSPTRIETRFKRSEISDACGPRDSVVQFAWPNLDGVDVGTLFPTARLDFCGASFPVPGDWRGYLAQMYGDWERLPNPADRRTHLPLKLVFSNGEIWARD